jgi:hypothetical protein
MFFLPTPEKPWFIEFANPPKKSGNTPQFNVWTRFVPPNVKLLLEAVKSPAFYRSDKLAQELIENARTTVDVKAVSASPSNVSSTATESASKATVNTVAVEVPSVEDDDF